jgi:outer membrane protein assembly factor BamB
MGLEALLIIVITVGAWLAFFFGVGVAIYRHVQRRGRRIILSGAGVTLLLIVSLVALNVSIQPSTPPMRPSPSGAILLAHVYDSQGRASLAGISARDGSMRWRRAQAVYAHWQAPIADGVAYLGTGPDNIGPATITAVRLTDGAQLWQRSLPATTIASPLALRGGALIFISYAQGSVSSMRANALDLVSHTLRWSRPFSHYEVDYLYPAFAASADLLYAAFASGGVTALRISDGSQAWSAQPLATPGGETAPLVHVILGGSALYTFDGLGRIAALRPADGALLWRGPAGLQADAPDYLTVTASGVYDCATASTANGASTSELVALDPATGAVRWERANGCGANGIRTLIESAGVLYQLGATLTALRASDGMKLWSASTQTTDLGFTSAQVDSGVIFVAATVIFPRDYTICANWWSGGPLFCHSPNFIAAYDAANGAHYWSTTLDEAPLGDAPQLISGEAA